MCLPSTFNILALLNYFSTLGTAAFIPWNPYHLRHMLLASHFTAEKTEAQAGPGEPHLVTPASNIY